jgi:hypothetical protein
VAKILLLGKLLNNAIPIQSNKIAKNGCQKEILPVLPTMPQVAKEIRITTHHGKTI